MAAEKKDIDYSRTCDTHKCVFEKNYAVKAFSL